VEAADADTHRERLPHLRVVDEEHGIRPDETPICSLEPPFAGTKRNETRSVGGDAGVVPRDPEATGEIAPAAGELGEEDVASCVELRLQRLRVVTHAASGERREAQGDGDTRDKARGAQQE
jgi:hypothetical protein